MAILCARAVITYAVYDMPWVTGGYNPGVMGSGPFVPSSGTIGSGGANDDLPTTEYNLEVVRTVTGDTATITFAIALVSASAAPPPSCALLMRALGCLYVVVCLGLIVLLSAHVYVLARSLTRTPLLCAARRARPREGLPHPHRQVRGRLLPVRPGFGFHLHRVRLLGCGCQQAG